MRPHIIKTLFDDKFVNHMTKSFPEIQPGVTENYLTGSVGNFHLVNDYFINSILTDKVLNLVSTFLGEEFYLWRSKFFSLLPGQKGQNYHQDVWPWWNIWPDKNDYKLDTNRQDVLSIWVPLIVSNKKNAGIHFIDKDLGLPLERDLLKNSSFQNSVDSKAICPEMLPGDAFLFDEYTLHGPGLRESEANKCAFVFRFVNSRLKVINRDDVTISISKQNNNFSVGERITHKKGKNKKKWKFFQRFNNLFN